MSAPAADRPALREDTPPARDAHPLPAARAHPSRRPHPAPGAHPGRAPYKHPRTRGRSSSLSGSALIPKDDNAAASYLPGLPRKPERGLIR
ncbi:hypothetical protein HMPREF1486_05857 [Streptomyces sp. HPH0547]|nr:hypothetical protein HMPREF1486_05857 [Streptomyces sp. HPH0547]